MERRQFLKSAAAAAALPALPSGAFAGSSVSAAHYARAAEIARNSAYMSASYLKYILKVPEETARAVIGQLEVNGLVGRAGANGVATSKCFLLECDKVFAKAAKAAKTAQVAKAAASAEAREGQGELLDRAVEAVEDGAERPDPDVEAAPAEPGEDALAEEPEVKSAGSE